LSGSKKWQINLHVANAAIMIMKKKKFQQMVVLGQGFLMFQTKDLSLSHAQIVAIPNYSSAILLA